MAVFKFRRVSIACVLVALNSVVLAARARPSEREEPPLLATIEIQTRHPGCSVDLDSGTPSKIGESGLITIGSVNPGDHYLHLSCPDGRLEALHVSPSAGEVLKVQFADVTAAPLTGLELVEARVRLRELIREAVRLRSRGRIEEAAQNLRDARKLDPENSDLHRELGITFLLGKEWKRARIEMLEAIRHEPTDADAYNGLAYSLEKLGHLEAAAEAYLKAMKLDPSDSTYRRHYYDAVGRIAAQQQAQNQKKK